jgi:transcription antitermination factor NusG
MFGCQVASPVFSLQRAETPKWYALHTRSNFERQVSAELGTKHIETYYPSYEEVHQWKDRKKLVAVPLFPGYVFVRFANLPAPRQSVLQTRGVVSVLGSHGEIEPIPDEEIESVQRLLSARVACYGHPFLREGMRVRVRRGPLRDLEGFLVRIKNQSRLVISINLISQSVATEVDSNIVEPVCTATGKL